MRTESGETDLGFFFIRQYKIYSNNDFTEDVIDMIYVHQH